MSETVYQDPETNEDWRDAALMAHAWRVIQSGKDYGLLQGGPEINGARCDEILEKYAKRRPFQRAFTREEISQAAVYLAQNVGKA